jgi:hypothetical protein
MTAARLRAMAVREELRAKRLVAPRPLAPVDAAHVLEVLRDQVWPLPEFAMIEQARITTDEPDELRVADALVIDTRRGPDRVVVIGVEVKLTMADYLAEIGDLAKSRPARELCDEFWIAVRAPYTRIVPKVGRTLRLPERWGLLEVAGGRASVIVHPIARPAALALSADNHRALYRAALRQTARAEIDVGAPYFRIVGQRDAGTVVLACDHIALAPFAKRSKWPEKLPASNPTRARRISRWCSTGSSTRAATS